MPPSAQRYMILYSWTLQGCLSQHIECLNYYTPYIYSILWKWKIYHDDHSHNIKLKSLLKICSGSHKYDKMRISSYTSLCSRMSLYYVHSHVVELLYDILKLKCWPFPGDIFGWGGSKPTGSGPSKWGFWDADRTVQSSRLVRCVPSF